MKQELFYPLYEDFDKKFFEKLKIAVDEKYEFVGSDNDKIFFTKCLFYYQLLVKDYRKLLEILYENLSEKTNIRHINEIVKTTAFDSDSSWLTWKSEREMVDLVEVFYESDVKIVGTDKQFDEFVLRYLVSVWLVDWQGPLYASLILTKDKVINLSEINKVLSLWDFTRIFKDYR